MTSYAKSKVKNSISLLQPTKMESDPKDKKKSVRREWEMLGDHFDDSWKDLVESIMKVYTVRTHGTYIEHKGNTVLWQYRDADAEFGKMQAQELRDHLDGVLKNFPVSVELGKTYVEVRPDGCDKGIASYHVIHQLEAAGMAPDFILAMGDDVADERMFRKLDEILPNLQEVASEQFPKKNDINPIKMFTCVVGKKPTEAKNYLDDVDDVESLLSSLAKASMMDSRSQSLVDIRALDIYHGSIAAPEPIDEDGEENFLFEDNTNIESNDKNKHTVRFSIPSNKKNMRSLVLQKFGSSDIRDLPRSGSRGPSPRSGTPLLPIVNSSSGGMGIRSSKSMPYLSSAASKSYGSDSESRFIDFEKDDAEEKVISSQEEDANGNDSESGTTEVSTPKITIKRNESSKNFAEYIANAEDGAAPDF